MNLTILTLYFFSPVFSSIELNQPFSNKITTINIMLYSRNKLFIKKGAINIKLHKSFLK